MSTDSKQSKITQNSDDTIIFSFFWKNYHIKDKTHITKLKSLDSYHYFYGFNKSPLIMLSLLLSFFIILPLSFAYDLEGLGKAYIAYGTLFIYTFIHSVYLFKIYLLLRKANSLNLPKQ